MNETAQQDVAFEQRKLELLKQTLFYKGEQDYNEAPNVFDGQSACYWDYERLWVRWELEQDEEYIRTLNHFVTQLQKNQPVYPSVPIGLQAVFASRISYWDGGRNPVTLDDVHKFCDKYLQAYAEVQKQ